MSCKVHKVHVLHLSKLCRKNVDSAMGVVQQIVVPTYIYCRDMRHFGGPGRKKKGYICAEEMYNECKYYTIYMYVTE